MFKKKYKICFQILIEIQAFLTIQLKLLDQISKNIDAKGRCFFLKAEANGENIYAEMSEAKKLEKKFFGLLNPGMVVLLNIFLFSQFNRILGLINKI